MNRFFSFILKRNLDSADYSDPDTRSGVANLQGTGSIIVNALIFIIKLSAGILINSISLIADSIHTLSDILSSIIIMVGFKLARKPADSKHPFGHQRIESITGIIVAVLLIVTGIEFLRSSFERILEPGISLSHSIIIVLVIVTIVLKELLARFALFLGRTINSSAIKADFWHHRIDAVSSLFVLIALISNALGFPSIDGYMGILVSLMIMYSGIKILMENSDELIGSPPADDLIAKIESIVDRFKDRGVFGIHDLIVNYYGNRIVGSLHIEIDEQISLMDAHTISEDIEDTIDNETGMYITIHIDPLNVHNPLVNDIRNTLREFARRYDEIDSVHDVRLIGSDNWLNVAFDLSINSNIPEKRKEDIRSDMLHHLKSHYSDIHDIVIKFEPLFSY
ncbi:MAG: cation diffusion facilitator family transporter [bacterium]